MRVLCTVVLKLVWLTVRAWWPGGLDLIALWVSALDCRGDTKSRWSLLSGVYPSGSKRSHQSALEMCNLPWTPPLLLREG